MEHLTFDTDLHCQACVNKIAPALDRDDRIKEWSVDLDGKVKKLDVKGFDINQNDISSVLSSAGYTIIDQSSGFWKDLNAWKRASFNTLNCLIGCSIGDFGMVFYLQAFYPETPLMLQMTLAIIAGLATSILLETSILRVREKFGWALALRTAFGMSFISMVAMEFAMTSTDFAITGGQAAFDDPIYWLALLPALLVGYIVPLPYNYFRLKKFNQACH